MSRISTRRITSAATALLLAGGVGLSATAPASATAHGCSDDRGPEICVSVIGEGNRVDRWDGRWTADALSNWRIDMVSYDRMGRVVWQSKGSTHRHTDRRVGGRSITVRGGRLSYGRACAHLVVNNRLLDAACVWITP